MFRKTFRRLGSQPTANRPGIRWIQSNGCGEAVRRRRGSGGPPPVRPPGGSAGPGWSRIRGMSSIARGLWPLRATPALGGFGSVIVSAFRGSSPGCHEAVFASVAGRPRSFRRERLSQPLQWLRKRSDCDCGHGVEWKNEKLSRDSGLGPEFGDVAVYHKWNANTSSFTYYLW
jgi:hypothetical protein